MWPRSFQSLLIIAVAPFMNINEPGMDIIYLSDILYTIKIDEKCSQAVFDIWTVSQVSAMVWCVVQKYAFDYMSSNHFHSHLWSLVIIRTIINIRFKKLYDKRLSPLTVRIIMNMYLHGSAQVRWDSTTSHSFNVTSGVKQGSVI